MEAVIHVAILIFMAHCADLQKHEKSDQGKVDQGILNLILNDLQRTNDSRPLVILIFDDVHDSSPFNKLHVMGLIERFSLQIVITDVKTAIHTFASHLVRGNKSNIYMFTFLHHSSLKTALNIQDSRIGYGNSLILRHFAKWFIITGRSVVLNALTEEIIQDNIALICVTKSDKCINNMYWPLQKQPETKQNIFTLFWTQKGREWSRVEYNSSTAGLTSLFPNIKYGLNNRELTIAVLSWMPSLIIEEINNNTIYSGVGVEIVRTLAQKFNFRFIMPPDRAWGSQVNHTYWTGIIGMLQRGESDFCPVPYAKNPARMEVIEFSILFTSDPRHVVYKSRFAESKSWTAFLTVFQWEIYAVGAACLVVVIGLFLTMEKSKVTEPSLSGAEMLMVAVGPPLQQGLSRIPSSDSGRILLGSWWLFCLIVTSVYTSQLTAVFTATVDDKPFASLEELAKNYDYRIGINSFSFLTTVIKNSSSTVYRTLYERTRQNCSPDVMNSTMEVKCQRKSLKEGGYALITSIHEISHLRTEICYLSVMRERVLTPFTGMIFPRHSPLAELFSPTLLAMTDSGLIDKWTIQHTPKPKRCTNIVTGGAVLSIKVFLTVVFAGCAGIFLACIVLIIERYICKRDEDTATQNHPKKLKFVPYVTDEKKIQRPPKVKLCHSLNLEIP